MPRFDKTGPEGKGPKTGKQLGNCGIINNTKNLNIRKHLFGKKIRNQGNRNVK